jgi:hypothetical protein
LLRNALAHHSSWIEETLGVPLADTIATFTDLPLAQLAITHVLGLPESHGYRSQLRSFDQRVLSIATPTDRPPLLRVGMGSERASKLASRRDRCLAEWTDLPIALQFHGLSALIIALPLASRLGPDSIVEDQDTVLIFEHSLAAEVLALLEEAELHERQPKLRVYQGATSDVRNAGWDDLVLDEQVNALLRRDLETFFERETWFLQRRLPFRRGYLLHGPPGNGKTCVVRAMMGKASQAADFKAIDHAIDCLEKQVETAGEIESAAGLVGQHNWKVLNKLGLLKRATEKQAEILRERVSELSVLERSLHFGPRTSITTPLRSKRPWIRSLMLLRLEICQESRPWECGNPEGISKECGKGGKPASWLCMLSILCHFHGLLWKTHFTKSQSLRRPVLGTGTTCPRCRLSGGA